MKSLPERWLESQACKEEEVLQFWHFHCHKKRESLEGSPGVVFLEDHMGIIEKFESMTQREFV